MSCKLLDKHGMIHDITMGNGMFLRRKDNRIQSSTSPINNIYWVRFGNEKGISMEDFKYVEYEDQAMVSIRPFKRSE